MAESKTSSFSRKSATGSASQKATAGGMTETGYSSAFGLGAVKMTAADTVMLLLIGFDLEYTALKTTHIDILIFSFNFK